MHLLRNRLISTSLLLCSPFDPGAFMNQTIDAPMDTVVKQCAEGEYRAIIDDFDEKAFRTFTSDKNGQGYTVFSPPFVIQDAQQQAELGREKVVVYHKGMFIDVDSAGGLDFSKGKNVDLGKLRDALGQNFAGQPWSLNHLKGAGPVMVRVVHEADKNDPEKKYARVSRVTKIS